VRPGALRALVLVAAAGTLAVAGLALSAGPLYAFGPATHIFLGERLLGSLHLLPAHIATLLAAHPRSFLYGSIAADISLAKKYAPVGRHCHFWHVGREIVEEATTDALKAVGLGYVSHLAADTVAHNFFVPRQLLLTSSTKALGHTYWESRLDTQLGEPYSARAREVVIKYDHSAADALFDQVLSATIFSFQTNRRIFRGMIRAQDNDRWKAVFDQVLKRSRWKLTDEEMESYLAPAFDAARQEDPSHRAARTQGAGAGAAEATRGRFLSAAQGVARLLAGHRGGLSRVEHPPSPALPRAATGSPAWGPPCRPTAASRGP
jgi:hypothetical protein